MEATRWHSHLTLFSSKTLPTVLEHRTFHSLHAPAVDFIVSLVSYFATHPNTLTPMTTPNESRVSKRRPGRRRLPPLAPGPALQFVVANHPDEFKADRTMRHVRSHVMYQHRDFRHGQSREGSAEDGGRSSTVAGRSGTSSPGTTRSDSTHQRSDDVSPTSTRNRSGAWDGTSRECVRYNCSVDPVRHLAHRVIMATSAAPARSAPPFLEQNFEVPFWSDTASSSEQDPLDDLRRQYMSSTPFFSYGMSRVPSSRAKGCS